MIQIEAITDLLKPDEEGYPDHALLDGYRFEDDLTGFGDLLSFKVEDNGTPVVDYDKDGAIDNGIYNEVEKTLIYHFPIGATAPQTITFQTKLSDDNLISGGTVSNTGYLYKDEETKPRKWGSDKVDIPEPSFTKSFDLKDGFDNENYNPAGRQITWYIEVNSPDLKLYNLKIYDSLDDELTWESASWQVWTAATNEGDNPWSTTSPPWWTAQPGDSIYEIGDFQGRGRLVIVALIPNVEEGEISAGKTHFDNEATATWTGPEGTTGSGEGATGEVGVDVGYNAITKTVGTIVGRQIPWTDKVDLKGQGSNDYIEALTVYDLIIRDSETKESDLISKIMNAKDEAGEEDV
ncbi:MAG: hypothetical protein GX809_06090 [Clostridiaceae bacterium]|nr:hypothetical protein [Clostridiaceae bacterium]